MAWLTGYPRDQIDWYPTIDPEKCVKFVICMNYGMQVYEWTKEGARVKTPYNCVVGYSTCPNLCLGNAISFPNLSTIRDLYKKEGIQSKL